MVVDPDRPRFLGPALADAITGIYASYGILGALFDRSRTGKGRVVEVSMLEAMAHFAVEPFTAYFALGTVPKSADRPRLAQAHILRTGDGGLIAIHLSSLEKFWTGLVTALECARTGHRSALQHPPARASTTTMTWARELDRRFPQRPVAEWVEKLGTSDVPFAPINKVDAVVEDPQVKHLGLWCRWKTRTPRNNPYGRRSSSMASALGVRCRAAARTNTATAIRAQLAASPQWPALAGRRIRHNKRRLAMLFPTTLVGSYPQPEWLIDRKKLAGRFPPRVRAKELWRVPEAYPAIRTSYVCLDDRFPLLAGENPQRAAAAFRRDPTKRASRGRRSTSTTTSPAPARS